tara:strand:- start:3085 stop:4377 length:1293 start_codon:yes stop_codon:yes gene_type:complete
MSTYPTHKPSGIEWLGDIPEHWISTRVKNALVFDIGGTPSRNKMEYFDGDNLWVSIADLNNQDLITDTNEKITDEAIEDSNCKLIPKDSLLFSFKLSVGHLAFAGSNLYTNEAIAAFRPSNRLNVRFLKYLLQIEFESNANTNIYGAYLFNKETLGAAKIVFPDDSKEQTAIANYLDEKTSKLDQLISNKKAQIEKLKEIRQIEIYTAVTKGLNANVKLKPSGIEWLGDIPEHWEVKRLKLIGKNIGGLTYSPDDVLEDESGTLVLRSSNIQNGKFSKEDNVFVDLEISNKQTTYVDDILLCARNGSVALVGKNILIDEETSGLSFGAFMSVFRSKSNSYIYWFFNSPIFSAQKGLFSTTTINQLTSRILYAMYSALPPIEEQTAIADYLDKKTGKLDQLVSNLENQIEQLQEVRKIEIYNAVTGKIKID